MRNLLLVVFVLVASIKLSAQTFETVKTAGFDIESGKETNQTFKVDGKEFNLFSTSSGSLYIKCLSKRTGKSYAVWIGEAINIKYEGKEIYKTKSGKYCIYTMSPKSGNPRALYLKKTS